MNIILTCGSLTVAFIAVLAAVRKQQELRELEEDFGAAMRENTELQQQIRKQQEIAQFPCVLEIQ